MCNLCDHLMHLPRKHEQRKKKKEGNLTAVQKHRS